MENSLNLIINKIKKFLIVLNLQKFVCSSIVNCWLIVMTWLTSTSLLFGLNVNPNLCLFLTVTLIVAAIYKLTYWHRLGIPNDISSLWNRWTKPFHESDTQAYRKYGRIVG